MMWFAPPRCNLSAHAIHSDNPPRFQWHGALTWHETPMPRFHRRSRLLNRIFFALVIAAGLYGWYFGARYWQPDPSALDLNAFVGGADWIELIAGLLEDAIQLFQDFTSQSPPS